PLFRSDPALGQAVAGHPPVEDALGVEDLPVTGQVDPHLHHQDRPTAAAARAAAGSAATMVSRTSSVCAWERNQASNADGGRWMPSSSIDWKNAACAAVSCVRASS